MTLVFSKTLCVNYYKTSLMYLFIDVNRTKICLVFFVMPLYKDTRLMEMLISIIELKTDVFPLFGKTHIQGGFVNIYMVTKTQ